MSCAFKIEHRESPTVGTILPGETIIPLICDSCFAETEIAIRQMVAGNQVACRCCSSVRTILPAEVTIVHQLLRQYGYYARD